MQVCGSGHSRCGRKPTQPRAAPKLLHFILLCKSGTFLRLCVHKPAVSQHDLSRSEHRSRRDAERSNSPHALTAARGVQVPERRAGETRAEHVLRREKERILVINPNYYLE